MPQMHACRLFGTPFQNACMLTFWNAVPKCTHVHFLEHRSKMHACRLFVNMHVDFWERRAKHACMSMVWNTVPKCMHVDFLERRSKMHACQLFGTPFPNARMSLFVNVKDRLGNRSDAIPLEELHHACCLMCVCQRQTGKQE